MSTPGYAAIKLGALPYFNLATMLTTTAKNGSTMALIKHVCFKTPDLSGQNMTRNKLIAMNNIATTSALRMAPPLN